MTTKKEKPLVKAVAKGSKSPAANYSQPNLFTVATEVNADEPDFMPIYNSPNVADVRILVAALNHQNVQAIRLNHRTSEVFDCGLELKLPEGFRLAASIKREWANRGLLLSHVYQENNRVKLMVINIGHETPLVIPHKEYIAQIWVEPVYFFDWIKK